MSTRTLLRDTVVADDEIIELVPKDRWTSGRSFDEANLPDRPFAVIRWGVVNPGMGGMTRRLVTFWIHSEPGSYETIDSVLSRLKAILDGTVHLTDGQGNWLSSIEWQSDSGDLYDPGYRTNTKNSTYEIIGTGV